MSDGRTLTTRSVPETVEIDGTTYVRAYPVAPGRCAHCGGVTRKWTPARIIDRLNHWRHTYGTVPSANKLSTPPAGYPSTRVVVDYFGSWDNALQAADLPANPHGAGMVWTEDRIVEALVAWGRIHGDAPTAADWLAAGPHHPAARTVLTRFGTWNAAIDRAGFFPRGPWGQRLRGPGADSSSGGLVIAEPVADAVRDYLGPEGEASKLAELMGMDESPLYRLLRGKRERMTHRAADEILTAIGREDVLPMLVAA